MRNFLFSNLSRYPDLVIGLSQKRDGSMRLNDNPSLYKQNREGFLDRLGVKPSSLVSADLVHGSNIEVVIEKDGGKIIPEVDGLITAEKKLFLSITVADCLPISLYDYKQGVVGLIHGGWKNLAQDILKEAIEKLINNFGCQPKNILAGIGPGICQNHFEVKKDVLDRFKSFLPEVLLKENNGTFLDLKKIAKIQLILLGLRKENIEISPECTYCLVNKYFSHRRSRGNLEGVMMAVIGIR